MDFYIACKDGNLDLVKILINKESYLNDGLWVACTKGHLDIVKFIIESTSNSLDYWDYNYWGVCHGGHLDIVKFLIANNSLAPDYWNRGIDIVNSLIESGEGDWNGDIYGCDCKHGYSEIATLLIEKGATNYTDEQLAKFKKPKEFIGLNVNIIKMILNKY